MILGGTGHRPQKLWPNDPYNPDNMLRLQELITRCIISLPDPPVEIISGMALGFDQALAQVALDLNIPLHAAIPCYFQEKFWPKTAKDYYNKLLNEASKKVVVTPGSYAPWRMHRRNKYIVDNCTVLLACWDGGSAGGTTNCVRYAEKVGKEIWKLDPKLLQGNDNGRS